MSPTTGEVQSGSRLEVPEKEYECLVGQCPTVDILLGNVKVKCLLDTGSNVSTITETFFEQHFKPTLENCEWLSLSAANGLGIPYLGYFERDVCALGKVAKGRGILVVRDPTDTVTLRRKVAVPCILGMNVIKQFYEMEASTLDTEQVSASGSGEVWGLAFSVCQREQTASPMGFAYSTIPYRVPAGSMCFVPVSVPSGPALLGSWVCVESLGAGEGSPGELLVSNAVVPVENGQVAVQW